MSRSVDGVDNHAAYAMPPLEEPWPQPLTRRSEPQETEQALQGLIDSLPDAIAIQRDDGSIAFVNARTEQLFGYVREDLLGRKMNVLLAVPAEAANEPPRGGLLHAQPLRRSLLAQRKDGRQFAMEIRSSAFATPDGLLVSHVMRDTTADRGFQRVDAQQNRDLTNSDAAKDRVLESMAHELRSPLNAIIGFASILLAEMTGSLNAEQVEQIQLIHASGRRLLRVINDLLDIACIEAGRFQLVPEAITVQGLIEEIASAQRIAVQRKELELVLAMPEQPVSVHADRTALTRILLHLLDNAIKFTEHGEVRIALNRCEGNRVAISVADTGIGIRADVRSRVFDAFCRLHDRKTGKQDGAGLGLYLSRELSRLLDGSLTIDSEPGRGSTFTLVLPGEQAIRAEG